MQVQIELHIDGDVWVHTLTNPRPLVYDLGSGELYCEGRKLFFEVDGKYYSVVQIETMMETIDDKTVTIVKVIPDFIPAIPKKGRVVLRGWKCVDLEAVG